MNQSQSKKKRWKKVIQPDGVIHFIRRDRRKQREQLKNKKQSYDEWWQEKNMDGSFAYNGVTDDF